MNRWQLGVVILAMLLSTSCDRGSKYPETGLPVYGDSSLRPCWGREASLAAKHRIANFDLVDQSGRPVTQRDLAGKVYVASFIFTTCGGICPRIVDNLTKVQEAFAGDADVLLVSHSVMPDREPPSVLEAYGTKHGMLADKWRFLTGDARAMDSLVRGSYFADETDDPRARQSDLVHTEKVFLVDAEGRIRGVYDGTAPADVEQLIADVRRLRAGRGNG